MEFYFAQEPMERRILGKNQQGPKDHAVAEIGEKLLVFDGFSRVVKDIKIVFNNRPLQYVEDEFGSRVLTPVLFMEEMFTC